MSDLLPMELNARLMDAYASGRKDERDEAAKVVAALVEALARLCKSFPTDSDMYAAGWDGVEVEEGCLAYESARAALKQAEAWQS
jgi:hypothetical protein